MSDPAPPRLPFVTRLLIGFVVLVVLWVVAGALLGFVFSLIRALLFLALFAIVAWVVLVGPR